MAQPQLQVIIGSTRPTRVGPAIATWVAEQATAHGGFNVEIVDLVDYDLPVFNEPQHPATGVYTFDYTQRWAATIARADAFLFVIPEYNNSFNGAIKNALDYLYAEWRYKAAGIVSYGGVSAGIRAAQALKPVLTQLKLSHAGDLPISFFSTPVTEGVFEANDGLVTGAKALLDELLVMAELLKARRA